MWSIEFPNGALPMYPHLSHIEVSVSQLFGEQRELLFSSNKNEKTKNYEKTLYKQSLVFPDLRK